MLAARMCVTFSALLVYPQLGSALHESFVMVHENHVTLFIGYVT